NRLAQVLLSRMEPQVDSQIAAPAETRTTNLHRAKIAPRECGWKGGDSGEWAGQKAFLAKENRSHLTPPPSRKATGLIRPGFCVGQCFLRQSSVNFICREGFRGKIAKPLTGLIVTRVIGVLECLEKLCKSVRPSTVFGRTTSFTRHACQTFPLQRCP